MGDLLVDRGIEYWVDFGPDNEQPHRRIPQLVSSNGSFHTNSG